MDRYILNRILVACSNVILKLQTILDFIYNFILKKNINCY